MLTFPDHSLFADKSKQGICGAAILYRFSTLILYEENQRFTRSYTCSLYKVAALFCCGRTAPSSCVVLKVVKQLISAHSPIYTDKYTHDINVSDLARSLISICIPGQAV